MNKFTRKAVDIDINPVPKTPRSYQILPGLVLLRFVVAEDDADLRFVLNHLLSEAFPLAEVAVFVNGRDALDDFDRHGADFVVSNHSMPVMDGPTFVRNLRERSADLPILMVSDSPEARQEGAAAGINRFLDKTELTARLVPTVKALLLSADLKQRAAGRVLLAR